MKKVLYLVLLLLNLHVLYSYGSLERDKYLVGMDDTCHDPEILVSPDGDMYFFYIRDNKLEIEKKVFNSSGFVPIENDFFHIESHVKSIRRFRMSDDMYSLAVLANLNNEDSLYILDFDDDKLITVHNEKIDNDYSGEITDYNLYSIGNKEFVVTYLKDTFFYYTYINSEKLYRNNIADYGVIDYEIECVLESEDLILKGIILNENNQLHEFKIDKSNNSFSYITEYNSELDLEIDYFTIINGTDLYTIVKNDIKLFETKSGNTTVHDNNITYFLTYSDNPKVNTFKYTNNELLVCNSSLGNVVKYQFEYNELYYLTSEGNLFSRDLLSNTTDKLMYTSIVDFGFYYNQNSLFLITAKDEQDSYGIEVLKRDNLDFTPVDSFLSPKSSKDSVSYTCDNNLMNIIYRTENKILDIFKVKRFENNEGQYQESVEFDVILTRIDKDIQLEVIK